MPIKISIVGNNHGTYSNSGLSGERTKMVCSSTYATGEEAVCCIPLLKPDVVLVDFQLPCMDGFECVRKLKARLPGLPVLMLAKGELAAENKMPVSSNLSADLKLPAIGISGVLDQEAFERIANPDKLLLLTSWKDATAACAWHPMILPGHELRHRQVRVIRDYGMQDRREAPQFYPPVEEGRCPYDKKP